jgi:hypothetical protein
MKAIGNLQNKRLKAGPWYPTKLLSGLNKISLQLGYKLFIINNLRINIMLSQQTCCSEP